MVYSVALVRQVEGRSLIVRYIDIYLMNLGEVLSTHRAGSLNRIVFQRRPKKSVARQISIHVQWSKALIKC